MKKELLLASALVSTMGVASVAEAVSYTLSGAHMTGLQGNDTDAADATISQDVSSDFSVSLSETTDGGVGIATSFMLANESSVLSTAGLTLTFTDGSKLDVIKAGNAAATHDVSVPGSAGEEGLTITTTNNAPTGIDFMAASTGLGIEWHSASDFLADGLKISASWSTDDGAANTATAKSITWRTAICIGLMQCLAMVPGISRSGATIAIATRLGIDAASAAKFSFLLAIPAIVSAELVELIARHSQTDAAPISVPLEVLAIGFIVAMVVGYLSLSFLLHILRRGKLSHFGYYCLAAGAAVLIRQLINN